MKRILAIVVTYNRLSELKNCLGALFSQTYQDFDICIVNNGSTDGTTEWLDEITIADRYVRGEIVVINQQNLGGAGGFYAGQEYALEHGYEWIWMMDDDGVPHPDQLQCLVQYAEKNGGKFLNALVVDKDDHSQFAFFAHDWTIDQALQVESIEHFVHPFNGTFIHTDVLKECGLTKKEMFIWGDEVELTMRYIKAGYRPLTVTSAIHYHPKEKGIFETVLPRIINKTVLLKPKGMSQYFYRNLGYIHGLYYRDKWYKGLKPMVMYAIYHCRRFDIAEACKAVKYYIRGMNDNYSD